MRKLIVPVLAILLAAQAARADVPQTTQYIGTINGTISISLSLTTTYSSVEGTYVYSLYGKDIGLTGSRTNDVAPKVDFRLKEPTGAFELVSEKDGRVTGTWKSTDGKKVMPVALTPVAKAITLTSAKSDAYQVKTGYLQFTTKTPFANALSQKLEAGSLAAHNKGLAEIAHSAEESKGMETGPFESEGSSLVMYLSDNLASVRDLSYFYEGGAHGMWGYGGENYAWINGKVVELKPEDIVAKDKWPALRDLCVKHLKEQGAGWPDDIAKDKDWKPNLLFTGQGLLVFFNPYEAGSYAEGAHVITLPWKECKSMIASNSPVAALLPK